MANSVKSMVANQFTVGKTGNPMSRGKAKILVVDDEPSQRKMLQANLSLEGYQVFEAADGSDAIARVSEEFFDLILMDNRMSNMDGIEALKEIKKISPGIPVIIITAYASVETAVEALQSGAHDYLTKPLDIEELKIKVQQTLEFWRLKEENILQKRRIENLFDASRIVGRSQKMKEFLKPWPWSPPVRLQYLSSANLEQAKNL